MPTLEKYFKKIILYISPVVAAFSSWLATVLPTVPEISQNNIFKELS